MLAAAPAGRTGVCIPKPLRKPRLASAASRRKRARAQRRGVRLRGCSSCLSVFIRGHQRETRTAGPVLLVLFFLTARLCHTAYAGVMSARDLRHDCVAADCSAQAKCCRGCRGADGVVRRTVDFRERAERFTELGCASSARRAGALRWLGERRSPVGRYIVAPSVHGANSSSPYPHNSLLDFSPEAVFRTRSKKRAPTSAIVSFPSTIVPQLMSMSSSCRRNSGVLVASLSEGAGLQP